MAGGNFDDTQSAETEAVLRRFNQVFLSHQPDALAELVADDCVIENTQPAPDGARYEGKEACVALWTQIATTPGIHFKPESILARGDRGEIATLVRRILHLDADYSEFYECARRDPARNDVPEAFASWAAIATALQCCTTRPVTRTARCKVRPYVHAQ